MRERNVEKVRDEVSRSFLQSVSPSRPRVELELLNSVGLSAAAEQPGLSADCFSSVFIFCAKLMAPDPDD